MAGKWTAEEIPDQHGRTAIVTGGNSGLGRVVARELARHGARVIIASRDNAKGTEAAGAITTAFPSSTVEAAQLDLANLTSMKAFADSCCRSSIAATHALWREQQQSQGRSHAAR